MDGMGETDARLDTDRRDRIMSAVPGFQGVRLDVKLKRSK